ncbi:MAG: MBOAT family protein, partial [Clostridia bacterium]|nr:MBOAT family protein [Clostridia bacterium]
DLRLTIASIGIMALLGVIKMAKGESIRVLIARQNIAFRWSIYAALVCSVVFFGMYGYGYDAQAFIYQGF